MFTTVMAKRIADGILSRLASTNSKEMTADKVGRIKGKFATLIWQYVRFNDKYRAEYEHLIKLRNENNAKEDELLEDFKNRWAISHLLECDRVIPPKSFYFNANAIQFFKDKKTLLQWADRHIPAGKEHRYLFAIIDLDKDPNMTLSLLKKQIENKKAFSRFKGSSSKSFGDNFVCYYLKEVVGMKPKDAIKNYKSICKAPLQNSQLIKKVKSFKRLSAASPFIFFNAGN